jgi:hypothetical protein
MVHHRGSLSPEQDRKDLVISFTNPAQGFFSEVGLSSAPAQQVQRTLMIKPESSGFGAKIRARG